MELLLDPDVAYLFLLGGVFLALMAIATPGTGFFEIGAFFCFALAGYAIYNLSINFWALIVIGLSVVPFVYALQNPKREWALALSILLLIVGSVVMFAREGESAGGSDRFRVDGGILVGSRAQIHGSLIRDANA